MSWCPPPGKGGGGHSARCLKHAHRQGRGRGALAELAEQHTARDELTISSLTGQLTAARDQQERAATARAEIAAATVQIDALRGAATAAAAHAEQRLADLRARHDEQLADLRTQLDRAQPQTGADTS